MKSNMCLADVISLVGRWKYHILYRLMLCHITAGRATFVTADFLAKCCRRNSHILECLILLPLMAEGIVM